MLGARETRRGTGAWVSSEGPVAHYVRRARRVAGEAGRRAAAPIVAARNQREELEQAVAELSAIRTQLTDTRRQLDRARAERDEARANRDGRRATEAVELLINRAAAEQPDLTAPELRDLALAVADLDANRTPGVIVVLGAGPYPPDDTDRSDGGTVATAVLVGAVSATRVLHVPPDVNALDTDELVALAYLRSTGQAAVTTSLQRIAPVLVSGGRIVVDAYHSSTECRAAVDEYFRDRHMDFRFEQHNRLHVVRR
jgi:hypothetical protein